uniref:Uncharacterized protein n=1 Tax=Schistosoma haematobium TaxID=6185 RepID=A0A095A0M9_SCHHA
MCVFVYGGMANQAAVRSRPMERKGGKTGKKHTKSRKYKKNNMEEDHSLADGLTIHQTTPPLNSVVK